MMRLNGHRAILFAALAAATGPTASQAAEIRGTVAFETGEAIPQGRIEIYLDDTAASDNARAQADQVQINSDGGMKAVEFSLPAGAITSQTQQIVAKLTRKDGWLIARGSAAVTTGEPVQITLYTVMY